MSMLELILARHGESFGNLDRSLGPDTALTERGRAQAARLRDWLADTGYAFSAIYCSPLQRARQTAEVINAHFGLEIVFEPDLRETEHAYLDQMPHWIGPLNSQLTSPFEAVYEAFHERVMRATARILSEQQMGQVLVVAHAGTVATMLRGILSVEAVFIWTEKAAVHALRWENGHWHIQYLNRQEHLVGAV